jgi:hypothetical protein
VGLHPQRRCLDPSKLVGTGAVGNAQQNSVALSADGNTATLGGPFDNPDSFGYPVGAAWAVSGPGRAASWSALARLETPSKAGPSLGTSEGLELVRAVTCIEDAKLRRAIVRLVEEIAPDAEPRPPGVADPQKKAPAACQGFERTTARGSGGCKVVRRDKNHAGVSWVLRRADHELCRRCRSQLTRACVSPPLSVWRPEKESPGRIVPGLSTDPR